MRRAVALALALVLVLTVALAVRSGGATNPPGVKLVRIGTFDDPLYVTAPPKDTHRVFVVEQAGRIRVVRDGRKLKTPFLDIRGKVKPLREQGLLSMAFAPDYAKSRLFYVFYTADDGRQHIEEYRAATRDRADPASARTVLIENDLEENDNGGQLVFGPDGYLYIGSGDEGGSDMEPGDPHNTAQDLGSVFGKLLRIDPRGANSGDYTVPPDNPFPDQRAEVFTYGLRNPWRFSFDRKTGALAIGDVGRGDQEEIDYFTSAAQARGANLGWPAFEGTARRRKDVEAPGHVAPVLALERTKVPICAIIGGYVSRDPKVPALKGRYVFSDFCHGEIRVSRLHQPTSTQHKLGLKVSGMSSFGEDARGRLYAVSINGPVYRLAAKR